MFIINMSCKCAGFESRQVNDLVRNILHRQFYKVILSGHQECKYINNLFFCRIHHDFKYLPGTKKRPDENNSFKTSTN